jgi:HSP20 family protein
MTVFRWPALDPLAGFRHMQRELERLVSRGGAGDERQGVGGGVYPPINVYNSSSEIVVEAEVTGVKRDDLDLSITGETLVIRGQKKPSTESPENVRYHRHERGTGDFSRTIVLPDHVDGENIQANLKAGVLTVRLPKTQAAMPRKIEVK